MDELTRITAREANQRFAEVLAKVETEGKGFLVTKHGRPVARLLPVEAAPAGLTPEQEKAKLAELRPLEPAGQLLLEVDAHADDVDPAVPGERAGVCGERRGAHAALEVVKCDDHLVFSLCATRARLVVLQIFCECVALLLPRKFLFQWQDREFVLYELQLRFLLLLFWHLYLWFG